MMAGVAALVYGATLYRSVPGGDSGEFIMVAHQHGVAHPPGYPLYSLLAGLFAQLPLGEVATRINALSACCGAAAVGLLAALILRLCNDRSAAVLAAGLFAFAPLVWSTAVAAEVFALNNLLVLALLHEVLSLEQAHGAGEFTGMRRHAWRACLWAGLGLSHHHIIGCIILPAAALCLFRLRHALRPAVVAGGVAMLALGLLPILYLPLAAAYVPTAAWSDTATWQGLFDHLLRRDYGTWQLAHADLRGATSLPEKLAFYGRNLAQQTLWGGVPLALWGAYRGPAERPFGRLLAATWVGYVGLLLALSNVPFEVPLYLGIAQRFWQQALCLAACFLGVGWALLWRRRPPQAGGVAMAVAMGLVLLQLGLHWQISDRRHDTVFADLCRAVLEPLPQGAALLVSGDHLVAALHYVQRVQNVRPDVRLVDPFRLLRPWGVRQARQTLPDLAFPGAVWLPAAPPGSFNLRQWVAANLPSRRIFLANGLRVPHDGLEPTYRLWPCGPVEEILPVDVELPLPLWLQRDAAADATMRQVEQAAQHFADDTWEHEVQRRYWQERHGMAAALYQYAQRHRDATGRAALLGAAELFERVRPHLPPADPQILKNLGATYQQIATFQPAARAKMRAAWLAYLQRAPWTDPDVPAIRRATLSPAN